MKRCFWSDVKFWNPFVLTKSGGQRLEEAKTTEEVKSIIIQFCHAKGLKVKNVG